MLHTQQQAESKQCNGKVRHRGVGLPEQARLTQWWRHGWGAGPEKLVARLEDWRRSAPLADLHIHLTLPCIIVPPPVHKQGISHPDSTPPTHGAGTQVQSYNTVEAL